MGVMGLELEGKFLRAKVPIPFVEENTCMPSRIYVEGYFPVGTVFKCGRPVCSVKLDPFQNQVNDYCHAIALTYSEKYNGDPNADTSRDISFHVDLSALFLLTDLLDESGNVTVL
ncbi:MAG TPA: hypothetical protein DEP57_07200 [Selenomonas sp.]|nr:hypothetical protein [Selenomonadaceae bacterium]HCB93579.1 hypothetical protein [Selenomonas sp.]